MAFTIQPYTLGDPITPDTTYSLPTLTHSATALTSTYQKVVLEATTKTPADDAWSNILPADYVVNGEVCGTMLDFTSFTSQPLYFRVPITDPAVKYATIKLNTLGFNYPDVAEIKTYEDASGATSGYWDITSLVEKGSVHTLSVVQANLGVSDPNITQPVINILGVGSDSTVRSVMREGQQGPAQFPFLPDSLRTVVHLSAPEGFTYKFTVQKVNFGGASGGFDPTQDADITGTWSFSKVSGLTMNNEAPIILGHGVDAVKIHGSGTGPAVIEGSNSSSLSIAIPISTQETVTAHDGISFDSSTITTEKNLLLFVGPYSTMRLAQSADGNLHVGPITQGGLSVGTTGVCAFSSYVYLKGATFEQGVTLGSTMTVSGAATFTSGIQTPATAVSYFGPLTQVQGTSDGGLNITGGIDKKLTTNLAIDPAGGINYVIVGGSSTAQTLCTMYHPTLDTYGCKWTYTANNGYYQLRHKNGTAWMTFDPTGDVFFSQTIDVTGASVFKAGVTMNQTLTVAGASILSGGITFKTGFQTIEGQRTPVAVTFQPSNDAQMEDIQLQTDAGGAYIRLSRTTFYMGSATPDANDVLNVSEMDLRYMQKPVNDTPMIIPGELQVASLVQAQNLRATSGINKNNQPIANLTDTSVLNRSENDDRYCKLISLTYAQYTDLATKDPATLYRITDNNLVYLGTIQL